ncbi:glycoside hydrolase family 20 protein [Jiulongibacter sp. NS-SX5]|uniref:glycoside hydrolase family 20 protein n=1 Tax=Jiulongibacter sp. NS-SX5 TaxID=3463854 RepID=UPI004057E80D
MKIIKLFALLLFSFSLTAQNIIPKPVSMVNGEGKFSLNSSTSIINQSASEGVSAIAEMLRLRLASTTHLNPEVLRNASSNYILLKLDKSLEGDAYAISVTTENATLTAGTDRGMFYAYQTLLQLFQDQIYSSEAVYGFKMSLPVVEIKDQPRFGYRGIMLDVGRHMMPVSFIKKFIDLLAMYKINQFHWHLTEDQGWRIEIKKYPKLTEVGAYRKETMAGHYGEGRYDGTPYGGFYTQEEVKEVVAYATSKYINVIPEIEMPGHAVAALTAYPELGCTGGPYEVRTKWGVATDVYCPYEKTFTFLEDVLTEVMALFPSEYIHIGGDECPKDTWEASEFCQELIKKENLKDEHGLQSYFIGRIDKFLTSKGRKLIGWDEILEGGLSPNATVMSWRGTEGGVEAARQKHDVIMSPNSFHYLDYYQGDPATEPLAIGGFLPLEKVYSYEPFAEEITPEEEEYILGVQANLWTEYIKTPKKAEYMLFPRVLAVAETGWSAKGSKDYDEFVKRVVAHFGKLNYRHVNYSRAIYNIESELSVYKDGGFELWLENIEENPTIRYTLDGSEPTGESPKYNAETGLFLTETVEVKAALFDADNQKYGNTFSRNVIVSKASGKSYELNNKPTKFKGTTENALTDGILGNQREFATWIGLNGEDLNVTLDLEEETEINKIGVSFLHSPGAWVYYPLSMKISLSTDGENFESLPVYRFDNEGETPNGVGNSMLKLDGKKARYIKVEAENFGELPADHSGAGSPAWLFVSEIEVY